MSNAEKLRSALARAREAQEALEEKPEDPGLRENSNTALILLLDKLNAASREGPLSSELSRLRERLEETYRGSYPGEESQLGRLGETPPGRESHTNGHGRFLQGLIEAGEETE